MALLGAAWRILRLLPPMAAYKIVHSAPPGLARLLARLEGRPRLGEPVRVFGAELDNPVGLAAGLDKDANLTWISWALGFGFTVVGSVLPRPHRGAEKKILRRLPDGGLVNRLGLPSAGARIVAGRLSRHRPPGMPVAVNIAALEPEGYAEAYRLLAPHADWVEVNISCPNTVEHGTFERPEWARRILESLRGLEPSRPLLLKIPHTRDPDLLAEYASVVREAGAQGIVAGNTMKITVDGVQAGLSGPRLFEGTLFMVERLREMLPEGYVIVGVGGVDSWSKVSRLRDAGADLVEVLSALLYYGPGRVRGLLSGR